MTPDNYLTTNSALWNRRTEIHTTSAFYDDAAFRQGKNTLHEPELAILGNVAGLRLLHLQCHFGQDTLSLARMGAIVTGVDISPAAIAYATQAAGDLNLNADFICADVCNLPASLSDRYDIVFTSYGTIVWLPDVKLWASNIARCLRPGGRLIFADTHPVALMFDDNFTAITYPYFNNGPIYETEQGTYADRNADIALPSVTWNHSMSDVLQALIDNGLTITHLSELDYSPCNCFGNMTETAPCQYKITGAEGRIPLTWLIEATRK